MATTFAEWVAKSRGRMSQAQLAREIRRHLGSEFTRDRVWDLEHGTPKNPSADLVIAVAKALGRSVVDALSALGYEIPREGDPRIDPEAAEVIGSLPLPTQRRLARLIPIFLELAASERDYDRRQPTLVRAAEPKGEYA